MSRARRPASFGLCLGLACVFVLLTAEATGAHPLAPRLLVLETADAPPTMHLRWETPAQVPTGQVLTPRIPPDCQVIASTIDPLPGTDRLRQLSELSCQTSGPRELVVDGLATSTLLVIARWEHNAVVQAEVVLDAARDRWHPDVSSQATTPAGVLPMVRAGSAHMAMGLDHVLFLISLVALLGATRRLIVALLGFTVGHAVAFALLVGEVVAAPAAVVEPLIGMTLVWAALVLALQQRGHSSPLRAPWLWSLGLGVVHGLGFANGFLALASGASLAWSVFWFHLGIELAQVVIAAGALVAAVAGRRFLRGVRPRALPRAKRITVGLIDLVTGSVGMWWLLRALLAGGASSVG